MVKKSPFYSILIPTYNRSHLLPMALNSILAQSFDDYEVIVSNGGSTDNTSEVVKGFDDSRIRYIESAERLSIGDNYQQALDNTQGEYVTFLSDDDAFSPHMLEEVTEIIERDLVEVLVFKSCFYFAGATAAYLERDVGRNSLVVPAYSGALTKYDRATAIRGVLGSFEIGGIRERAFNVSYLANAIYHHTVLAKIRRRKPNLFETTPADGYLALAVTFAVDSYHSLDKPLHVWTDWAENATASAEKKKNDLRSHYAKLLNGKSLDHVPIKFTLPLNCIYNALFMAKSDFDDDGSIIIEWADYYFRIHQNLMELKRIGINVNDELDEWHQSLLNETMELQKRVSLQINRWSYRLKCHIGLHMPSVFRMLKTVKSKRRIRNEKYFLGAQNNFENVFQCASFVGKLDRAGDSINSDR